MCQAAVKRLRVDYVDLVFCHRPDVETPIEETVRAMNWVIDQVPCPFEGPAAGHGIARVLRCDKQHHH